MAQEIEELRNALAKQLEILETITKNVTVYAESENHDWIKYAVKEADLTVDGIASTLKEDLRKYEERQEAETALVEKHSAELSARDGQLADLKNRLSDTTRENEWLSKKMNEIALAKDLIVDEKDQEIHLLKSQLENLRQRETLQTEPAPESTSSAQKRQRETHTTAFGYSPDSGAEKRTTSIDVTESPPQRPQRSEDISMPMELSKEDAALRRIRGMIAVPLGWTSENEETFMKQLKAGLRRTETTAYETALDKNASEPQTKKVDLIKGCLFAELMAKQAARGDKSRSQCGYCSGHDELERLCVWLSYCQGVVGPVPRQGDGTPVTGRQLTEAELLPKTVNVDGRDARWMMNKRREN